MGTAVVRLHDLYVSVLVLAITVLELDSCVRETDPVAVAGQVVLVRPCGNLFRRPVRSAGAIRPPPVPLLQEVLVLAFEFVVEDDAPDVAAHHVEGRHALRLDIKKLRYAAEFMAPLHAAKPLAGRRDKFVAALKVLQDRLGDLNDAWTAETLAARLPAKLGPLIARVHGTSDRAKALRAAERAFHRALAAGGYWQAAG